MILKRISEKSFLEWMRRYSGIRTTIGINSRALKEKRYYKKGAELRKEEAQNKRRVIFNTRLSKKNNTSQEEKSL
jgi:hypothetical protein